MCRKAGLLQGQTYGNPDLTSRHACSNAMYSSLPSLMKLATASAIQPSS